MGKKRLKYIEKLSNSQQDTLDNVIDKIIVGELDGLDIKPLKGLPNKRRCRVGKLRIVFKKKDNSYEIVDIGPKGDVYK